MTTETLLIFTLIITVASVVFGYFVLITKTRNAASITQQKLHDVELEKQKINILLSEREAQKNQLDKRAEDAEFSATTAIKQKHDAEKKQEATQAELQATKKHQEIVNVRLTEVLEELNIERSNLRDQIQAHSKLAQQAERSAVQIDQMKLIQNENKTNHKLLKDEHENLNQQYNKKCSEYTHLKTTLDEREANHTKQLDQFDKQAQSFKKHFEVLANNILDSKSKALQETNSLSINAVMSPFQASIDSFKKEVRDIHHRETAQQGALQKELESLKELNQKITTEAHELSTALRGQKKLQGNWGELVLENVLDRSGLQLGKDYKREVSFNTEEGRRRPDAIIYLPQNKHLIIDAKVSLNAYTRYVNSDDKDVAAVALKEHVAAMGARIKELATKDYYKLPGLNSPEMVFMFVPIESAFVEALKADETLFQSAIENNVLVATPTTLLTSLNIVRQLWRYEDQNKHTAALAQKAERVFTKLNSFLKSFEGVKKGLDKSLEAYATAEGQLISGKGNLVKQVSDFKNLAPAIKAELPSYFTDKADLEVEFFHGNQPPKKLTELV